MKAKYIMTRKVITCGTDTTVEEAKDLMCGCHVSGLPVTDANGRVVGIFSQTDALRREGRCVGDLMTPAVVAVEEEAGIEEVATLMAAKDVNRIPVLREGHLVGIISRADVIRYVATPHAWMKFQELEPLED
jgi:CBS domain-containing protein